MSGLVPLLVPSALAAVRRPRCGGIEAADRVLLVGEPATGVLVIYPLASLDALLPAPAGADGGGSAALVGAV